MGYVMFIFVVFNSVNQTHFSSSQVEFSNQQQCLAAKAEMDAKFQKKSGNNNVVTVSTYCFAK